MIVKKHCLMIYGIRTFPPGQLPTRTIVPPWNSPHDKYPLTFSTGKLPLNNPPAQLPPRQLPPMKFPPEQLSLRLLPPRQLARNIFPLDNYSLTINLLEFPPGQLTPGLLPPNEHFFLNNSSLSNYPLTTCPHEIPPWTSDNGLFL